jgi:hypothetical protein
LVNFEALFHQVASAAGFHLANVGVQGMYWVGVVASNLSATRMLGRNFKIIAILHKVFLPSQNEL